MQIPDPSSSQGWADKLLYGLVGGTVLSTVMGVVRLIFYRNKPRSEIAALDAETDVKLSQELRRLHSVIGFMEGAAMEAQRENLESIKYYRGQIEYFEKLDNVYRNRSHAMAGELQRLVLGIRTLEATYVEKTGEAGEPFHIRSSDEIVERFPLPLPPSE